MNNRSVAELLYFDTIKWTFDDVKACLQYFKQCIEEWKDLMALAQRGSLSSMHWTKSRFRNDSVREHSDDEPPPRYTRRAAKSGYLTEGEKSREIRIPHD